MAVEEDEVTDAMGSDFIDTVNHVKAIAVRPPSTHESDLGRLRGYDPKILMAIAEVGYHYLMSGVPRLAQVVFEGLIAIAPTDAYFTLALGLTLDHLDDVEGAERCYARAAELDPREPRADINRAEIRLEVRDLRAAIPLLESGRQKAKVEGDDALVEKAAAMLDHVCNPKVRAIRRAGGTRA